MLNLESSFRQGRTEAHSKWTLYGTGYQLSLVTTATCQNSSPVVLLGPHLLFAVESNLYRNANSLHLEVF